MSVSMVHPDSTDPYTQGEWDSLLDMLHGDGIPTVVLRQFLIGACMALSVIAEYEAPLGGPQWVASRRLRKIREALDVAHDRAEVVG